MGYRSVFGLGLLAPHLPVAGLPRKEQVGKGTKDRQVLVLFRLLCRPGPFPVDLAVVSDRTGKFLCSCKAIGSY